MNQSANKLIYGETHFRTVEIADSFSKRLFGLMGKRALPPGYALVFPNTRSIHTCFMRMPIDVMYLDAEDRVLGTQTIEPWRLGKAPKGTATVVECAAGSIPNDIVSALEKRLWRIRWRQDGK